MRFFILNILLFSALILFMPNESYSYGSDYVQSTPPGPFAQFCGGRIDPATHKRYPNDPGVIKDGKPLGNIVRCVNLILKTGSDRALSTYIRFFSSIVYYSVILAIMFHGMKMMFGVAKEHGVSIMLVIKITIVLYFCSLPGFAMLKNTRDTLINFPKAITIALLAEPAPNGVPVLGVLYSIPAGLFSAFLPNTGMDLVFDKIDIKICEMLGAGDNSNNNDPSHASSEAKCAAISTDSTKFVGIIAVTMGLFASGGMGAALVAIVLTYLTALIFLIAQLVFFYTVIAIAINFLMALAPLALACMLFEYTSRITKMWFNFLIIYTIQPIVMAAFIAVLITIMTLAHDQMKAIYAKIESKYTSSYSHDVTIFDCFGLTRKDDAGTDAPLAYSNGNGVQNNKKPACDIKMKGFKLDSDIATTISGAATITGDTLKEQDIRTLLAVKIAMIIFMILMGSFMKAVPEMVNSMVRGGGTSAPGLAGIIASPFDKLVNATGGKNLVESIGHKVHNAVKSTARRSS